MLVIVVVVVISGISKGIVMWFAEVMSKEGMSEVKVYGESYM